MVPRMMRSAARGGMTSDRARERMVREQLEERGIRDKKVLEVMRAIPRHLFVEEALAERAYSEVTLPIGEKQTLSAPYTVARMTEALRLEGHETVLEIGTGSGYQAAVLSKLCKKVFTIERLPGLAETARKRLRRLNCFNITFQVGDGTLGWPEKRTFDRIIVTAGAPVTPVKMARQLVEEGMMLVPEGGEQAQRLIKLIKVGDDLEREDLGQARFVPLVGEDGWQGGRGGGR